MKYRLTKMLTIAPMLLFLTACVSTTDTGGEKSASQASSETEDKKSAPLDIEIIQPAYDSTIDSLNPLFKWSGLGENVTYEFKLYNMTEPKKPIELIAESGLSSPQYKLELTLKPATDYGWTVRSWENGESSEWVMHETRVFTGISYHRRKRLQRFTTP